MRTQWWKEVRKTEMRKLPNADTLNLQWYWGLRVQSPCFPLAGKFATIGLSGERIDNDR